MWGTWPTRSAMPTWSSCSPSSGPCRRTGHQDRDTGRSKGFGFVEMGSDAEAQAAIQGLHDQEVNGRRLTVNEAKPREPPRRRWRLRRRRWGYGGGGRGGRGGGGGGRY